MVDFCITLAIPCDKVRRMTNHADEDTLLVTNDALAYYIISLGTGLGTDR